MVTLFSPVFTAANAVFLVVMTFMVKFFPTTRLGFFCGDVSIRYPELPETVSTSKVLASTIIIATILFSLGEYLVAAFQKRSGQQLSDSNTLQHHKSSHLEGVKSCISAAYKGSAWYFRAIKVMALFLWGVGVGHLVCYVLKSSFGHLRPNFWAVCRPNVTCSDPLIYHEDYSCTGADSRLEAWSRQAFPSGHATFAGYSAVFLVVYLQDRLRPRFMARKLFVLRPVLQVSNSVRWHIT